MTAVVEVLSQNILPIFLVAGLGFWLRRQYHLDRHMLARVVFFALAPCLVFDILTTAELPADELARLGLFTFLTVMGLGAVGLLAGRLLRLNRTELTALLLTLMFANAGNYGLTFNQLRYGDAGLARAVVYYVVSTMIAYSLGIFIASMGRQSVRGALARLLRIPNIYAVLLALLVYNFDLPVPRPLARGVSLAGSGAIPLLLVVLGMNIADMRGLRDLRLAIPASLLRLAAGPAVAVLVALALGLNGLNRSTSIIEASMPTAVMTTVLATEFDVQPGVVASVVVLSTLLSPISLPLVITILSL